MLLGTLPLLAWARNKLVEPIDDTQLMRRGGGHGDDTDSDKYMWLGIILAAGLIGMAPLFFRRLSGDEFFLKVMSLFNCFGGGALLTVALSHVIPEAFSLYPASSSDKYPAAGMLVVTGYWVLMGVDKVLISLCAKPSVEPSTPAEPFSAGPNEPCAKSDDASTSEPGAATGHGSGVSSQDGLPHGILQCLGVFLGMAIHSLMAGISMGLMTESSDIEALGIAIACHKIFDVTALCIVMVRADVELIKAIPTAVVVALMTPLGIILGNADAEISNNTNGALQALCGGTFLYVAIQEILAEEFSDWVDTTKKYLAMTAGMGCIGLASISQTHGDGHSH